MITKEEQIKKGYLTLGRPIWQIIKEAQPERRVIVAKRIKDLEAQKEMIDIELEMYGYKPVVSQKKFIPQNNAPKWAGSISGFHNPIKHKGLTPEKFVTLYIERMAQKHSPYYDELAKNKNQVIEYVKAHFSRTLLLSLLFVTFVPR